LIPDITGYVASNIAVCIAVAASSPGPMNCRYVTPPNACAPALSSTNEPSPIPIAARYISGIRKLVTSVPFQVRRYSVAQ